MCLRSQDGSFLSVAEKSVDSQIFSLSWIPSSARFCTVGTDIKGKGKISIYSLNGREIVETESVSVDNNLRCSTLETGDTLNRQMATGDFSGNLAVWDLETMKQEKSVNAHSDVLTCISSSKSFSNILTGGRDGEVKLWDPRNLEAPSLRMVPEPGQARKQCWSVCQSQPNSEDSQEHFVAAGFDNGDIKVFDVRNSKIAWETSLSRGISKLTIISLNNDNKSESKLLAGSVQGRLYSWSIRKPEDTPQQIQLDKSTIWEAQKLSNNKNLALTALGSGAMTLVDLDKGNMKTILSHQVSEPPLNCLSVSRDKPGLVATSSFDQTLRLFYYTGMK